MKPVILVIITFIMIGTMTEVMERAVDMVAEVGMVVGEDMVVGKDMVVGEDMVWKVVTATTKAGIMAGMEAVDMEVGAMDTEVGAVVTETEGMEAVMVVEVADMVAMVILHILLIRCWVTMVTDI